jgi:hypothetical protein
MGIVLMACDSSDAKTAAASDAGTKGNGRTIQAEIVGATK